MKAAAAQRVGFRSQAKLRRSAGPLANAKGFRILHDYSDTSASSPCPDLCRAMLEPPEATNPPSGVQTKPQNQSECSVPSSTTASPVLSPSHRAMLEPPEATNLPSGVQTKPQNRVHDFSGNHSSVLSASCRAMLEPPGATNPPSGVQTKPQNRLDHSVSGFTFNLSIHRPKGDARAAGGNHSSKRCTN
jgi:hypothetical protein